jgi:hypothetical protein
MLDSRGGFHAYGHKVYQPARCSTTSATSGGECGSRSATCYPCEAATLVVQGEQGAPELICRG